MLQKNDCNSLCHKELRYIIITLFYSMLHRDLPKTRLEVLVPRGMEVRVF